MVCPMTFRHPAMVAKMVAAVSVPANGRIAPLPLVDQDAMLPQSTS